MRTNFVVIAALACLSGIASAQWVNYRDPRTPRTSNGKPNLTAPAPRAGGKPDLSGVWQVEPTPIAELRRIFGPGFDTFDVPGDGADLISKYFINLLLDFKPEESPMRPEAERIFLQRREAVMPDTHCLPPGVPHGMLVPTAFKIVQTPGLILVAYESPNPLRQIYTDNRKPPADPEPAWMGYSVGHWDGDRLIVDVTGFNDKTWLDASGHPASEKLHVTERFHRRDFGHIDVETTIDDPVMYTRAFTVKYAFGLLPDTDISEYICTENEKDLAHIR
jgi:hypothetical protein